MKAFSIALPLTLALATGCTTVLGESAAIAPSASRAGGACLVAGPSRTIAPRARVFPGIEVASSANKLVVRVATKLDEAVEMDLDPVFGATTPVASPASPTRGMTGANACANTLQNAKTLAGDHPFAIGTSGDKLAWSTCDGDAQSLWDLPEPSVHDLQVVAVGTEGFAVVFREGNAVWLGRLDSEKKLLGSLTKVAERAHLRWLTVAESDGSVLLAWAEQEAGAETWSLGSARFTKSGRTKAARLDLPRGGIGGDALQPALAGLGGGRFLLAWTEGTTWTHQVRAVTLDSSGAPVGPALRVSDAVEAGWARPAITADGRGAVLFMTPGDGGFAVVATPIACPTGTLEESRAAAISRR